MHLLLLELSVTLPVQISLNLYRDALMQKVTKAGRSLNNGRCLKFIDFFSILMLIIGSSKYHFALNQFNMCKMYCSV